MRPPWSEGVALLAAAGHVTSARDLADRKPTLHRWRKPMSKDVRFALLTDNRFALPKVFPDIDAMARHIQRARGEMAIDMVPKEDLEIQGDAEDRPGISVFTQFEDGSRDRLIGHVWIGDLTLDHLKAALRRNRLVVIDDQAA